MATRNPHEKGDGNPSRFTHDTLFGGRVTLFQPRRGTGYRTNVDALLLARFAAPALPATAGRPSLGTVAVAYDLGSGVGAVGLSLLRFGAARRVVFVEIDGQSAAMARRNLTANEWATRGEVVSGDVRDVARTRPGDAGLVVCNPPYVAPGRGRAAPSEARARIGELGTFVEAARQLAGRRARVCFIYPAAELGTLLGTLESHGLHAKRLRFVHATVAVPARVALVDARAGRPGGLTVLPALVERSQGGYTPELESLLSGD